MFSPVEVDAFSRQTVIALFSQGGLPCMAIFFREISYFQSL
jgi:hypothetical protein